MLPAFQICAFSRREAYRAARSYRLNLAVEAQIPDFNRTLELHKPAGRGFTAAWSIGRCNVAEACAISNDINSQFADSQRASRDVFC